MENKSELGNPVKVVSCLINGGYKGKIFYSNYLSGEYTIRELKCDDAGRYVANVEILVNGVLKRQSLGLDRILNDRTI